MNRTSLGLSTLVVIFSGLSLSACGGAGEPADSDPGAAEEVGSVAEEIAFPLGSGLGSPVTTGTTCGAFNEYTSSCGGSAASDHSFLWTAPYAGTFTFTTAGSGYDTVLQLLDTASNASLGCNDDASGTLQSSLTASLAAGKQITIVVDGYSSSCGSFKLNIFPSSAVPTSGLKLWLRADAGTTLNGSNVSGWQDQSGNMHDGIMSAAGRQPALVNGALNGKPVIRFSGAQSMYLTSPIEPTQFTIFVVGKNSNPSETFSMILGPGGNFANNQLRWENGSQALFVGTGNNMPILTSPIGNTRVYHNLSARYNGSTMSVYRDGNLVSSHAFSTSGPWTLAQVGGWFSSYFLKGDIAEILAYDTVLSEGDRGTVNGYLKSKYALP